MTSHRDLVVWCRAEALTVRIYNLTESQVRGRSPSIVLQLRRAVESIAANIAEGAEQPTKPQFRRYLCIALGSANESDSHLALLLDLATMDPQTALDVRDELSVIRRMILALHKSLE